MLFVFILVFIFIFGIFHIIDCFVAGQLFDGFFWSVIMIVAIALLVKAVIKFWRQDDNKSNNYKGSSNSSRNDEEFYFWFMHEQERDRRRKQQEQQRARENIHNFNDDCRKNWNGEKELYEEYGDEYDTIDDFFADHKDD